MPSSLLAAARARPRPHIGSEQLKYQYFVTVHGLTFLPGGTCPSSNLSVLWTRGSKTAITQEAAADAQSRSAIFGQTLTLICTLFRSPSAASSSSGFSEKLCGFALIRHGSRGAQTLAKCKVDMAPFASAPPSAPLRRTLTLSKGSAAIAKLDVSISSRLQKELPRDGNDPSDRSDASSLSSCGSSLLDDVAYADDLDGELSERSGERAGERRSSRDGVSLGASRGAAAADGGVSASLASLTAGDLERYNAAPPAGQAEAEAAEAAARDEVAALEAEMAAEVAAEEAETGAGAAADAPACAVATSGGGGEGGSLPHLAAALRSTRGGGGAFASGSSCEGGGGGAEGRGVREVDRAASSLSVPPVRCGSSIPLSRVGSSAVSAISARDRLGSGASAAEGATVYSLDAQVSQLQAQLEAAQTLARKTHARFEGERREWGGERAQLREEAAGLRQQLIAADAASRQHAHESRQAAAQLGEARAEVARLRREKKELGSQLGPGGADADDRLAMQQDLQGKLDRSEQHREENARKLAKARKHQQSLLQQSEAEIELLSQRLEQMEDENCAVMQEQVDLEKAYVALQAELQEARRELEELQERAARREQIQPAGLQELQDQLEMADEVRATLCADIAKRTEELVQVKLERAQESVLLEETVHKLRHQTAKNRQLALRMTELEVQLAERENTSAETEEGIAGAFREVMQMQEKKIIDLEERLRESKEALDAAAEKGGGGSKPKRKGSLW